MLEIFDDLLIGKYKKAIARVLILLPAQLGPYRAFHALYLLLIVLLLVDSHPAAPDSHSLPYANLPSNGPKLLVFRLDESQLVQVALQLDAFFVEIVVIADYASAHKYTFAGDWVRWIQFHQIG